jgi:outer membrane biosynthesis protein TonB
LNGSIDLGYADIQHILTNRYALPTRDATMATEPTEKESAVTAPQPPSPPSKKAAKKKPRPKKAAVKKRVAKKGAPKKKAAKKRASKKPVKKKPAPKLTAVRKSVRPKPEAKKSVSKKRRNDRPSTSNGITKAQSIRDAAKAIGGKPRPRDVIAALAAKGITVSSPQVSSTLKAAGLRRRRRRKKVQGVVVATKHSANGHGFIINELVKVKKLADDLGGTAKLKELAAALEKLV